MQSPIRTIIMVSSLLTLITLILQIVIAVDSCDDTLRHYAIATIVWIVISFPLAQYKFTGTVLPSCNGPSEKGPRVHRPFATFFFVLSVTMAMLTMASQHGQALHVCKDSNIATLTLVALLAYALMTPLTHAVKTKKTTRAAPATGGTPPIESTLRLRVRM